MEVGRRSDLSLSDRIAAEPAPVKWLVGDLPATGNGVRLAISMAGG